MNKIVQSSYIPCRQEFLRTVSHTKPCWSFRQRLLLVTWVILKNVDGLNAIKVLGERGLCERFCVALSCRIKLGGQQEVPVQAQPPFVSIRFMELFGKTHEGKGQWRTRFAADQECECTAVAWSWMTEAFTKKILGALPLLFRCRW